MRNNPTFYENFNDNKLTQSVKLTEYRNANKQAYNQQMIRHSVNPMVNQEKVQQASEKSQKMIEVGSGDRSIMENMKQIKTQYSQISGVETGFKKLKGNQVQILKELRNQYEVLKNLQAQDTQREREIEKNMMVSPSNQSISQRDNQSVSQKSIKSYQKDVTFREEKLWNVERKQYELIISNCQQKIQQLLHAEMEYKKTIYELKNMPISSVSKIKESSQNTQQVKELQRQERQSREKSLYFQTELEKAKAFNRELNERIIKLQDELTIRDQDANRLQEEKKRFQDLLRLEKDKYMTNQIQKKKIQMEYQILQKDKSHEINRLMRQLEHREAVAEQDLKVVIKRLQEQIQVKNKRYALLLQQLESKKKDLQLKEKQQRERMKQEMKSKKDDSFPLQAFTKMLTEGRSNNNEQMLRTLNTILHTLQKSEKKQNKPNNMENQRLFGQIRLLKAEIETLRNSKNDSFDLEPIKKVYETQINGLKDTISALQQKLKRAKKSHENTPILIKSPSDENSRSLQIMRLNQRIQQLQNLVNEKELILRDHEQYLTIAKSRQEKSEDEIRALRRKSDGVQFQLDKAKRENEFNISMMKREHNNDMNLKNAEIRKVQENVGYWKMQFEKVKRFYEQKIVEKNRIIESTETIDVTEVRKQYDEQIQYAKKDYEQQIANLAEKVANVHENNENMDALKKKCLMLENTLYQMKKYQQKSRNLNEGVDHLWSIKEAEYGNLNRILQQVDYRF